MLIIRRFFQGVLNNIFHFKTKNILNLDKLLYNLKITLTKFFFVITIKKI